MQLSPGQDLSDSYLQKFIDTLKYSPEDLETTEILTRGQSDNKLWNVYRKGLITDSLIHEIHTRMKSVQAGQAHDASCLINNVLKMTGLKEIRKQLMDLQMKILQLINTEILYHNPIGILN